MRWAARLALGLVVLTGVAAVGFRIWVGAAEPPLHGRETVPGLGDSVTVLWQAMCRRQKSAQPLLTPATSAMYALKPLRIYH